MCGCLSLDIIYYYNTLCLQVYVACVYMYLNVKSLNVHVHVWGELASHNPPSQFSKAGNIPGLLYIHCLFVGISV